MGVFLLLLCFLCVQPVCSIFDGMCPRKNPPTGVLVVYPGSTLELTCSGHAKVNGVSVTLHPSLPNKRGSPLLRTHTTEQVGRNKAFSKKDDRTHSPTTAAGFSTVPGENQSSDYSDAELTTSSQVVKLTPPSKTTMGEGSHSGDEYKDKEWEEGRRVTRGTKIRPQWEWNKQKANDVDIRDWYPTVIRDDGSRILLRSVRPTDAGKYTCHYREEERLAVKLIVPDPPETPSIFCYKKSASSKIRCEWTPQKPIINQPDCYLFLKKRTMESFKQNKCSYSSPHSRCWCALGHNDNELRTLHTAFLCVTNILDNTTSPLIHFKPLDILKPDPPFNVSAHPVESVERRIKVTWKLPSSWKQQDNFYVLIYEIRYRPLTSSNEQADVIKERQYVITDALSGVEYLIQLRTKEEYDGQWSEWTSPVFARSWTANVEEENDPMTTANDLLFNEDYSSGFPDDNHLDASVNEICTDSVLCHGQYHILWISALFAVMSVLLAVYIFRHKDRFLSKLHSLNTLTHSNELSSPPSSIPSALVAASIPQLYKQCPPSDTQQEEESEEEQTEMDRQEAMNFNNKSYFFLQMEP